VLCFFWYAAAVSYIIYCVDTDVECIYATICVVCVGGCCVVGVVVVADMAVDVGVFDIEVVLLVVRVAVGRATTTVYYVGVCVGVAICVGVDWYGVVDVVVVCTNGDAIFRVTAVGVAVVW